MQQKKMFEPGKDWPNAFLTTTKKGKEVFRVYLNVDEILSQLEKGNTFMAIDIPAKNGNIQMRNGSKNGRNWRSFSFYAWAMQKKEEAKA